MADSLSLQGVGQLGAAQAVNSLSASVKATDKAGSAQSFGNVLNKAADNKAGNGDVKAKTDAGAKDGRIGNEASGRKGEDVARSGNDKVQSPGKEPKDVKSAEGTKDAVRDAAMSVKDEIKEELQVTDEEIISAMETLGLALTDLLKGENIGALTAELNGTDISEVVADESLYANVESILDVQREVTGELLQELDMTMDEFRNALDSGVFEPETVGNPLNGADAPDESIRDGADKFQDILENTGDRIISGKDTAGTPAETVKSSENTRETDRQPERRVEVVMEKVSDGTEAPEVPTHQEKSSGNKNFGASADNRDDMQGQSPNLFQMSDATTDFMDNLTEAVSETTSQFTNTYERVQDIVNQVRDQIRISVNQETTTMEMQLNPESLGRVGLHIESRAGNVTAQFFAQDESVRAALETQVAELRRNLEEQGIKVESVEVTLASREFESNFLNDQGSGGSDNTDREDAERTARLRRINLGAGGIEDIPEEELSEEELLNRRIMADNGGTVDFTA